MGCRGRGRACAGARRGFRHRQPGAGYAARRSHCSNLGSGTTLDGFKIRVDGIKVASEDAASVTVAHLTFAPGGTRHQGYLHIPPARVRPVSL